VTGTGTGGGATGRCRVGGRRRRAASREALRHDEERHQIALRRWPRLVHVRGQRDAGHERRTSRFGLVPPRSRVRRALLPVTWRWRVRGLARLLRPDYSDRHDAGLQDGRRRRAPVSATPALAPATHATDVDDEMPPADRTRVQAASRASPPGNQLDPLRNPNRFPTPRAGGCGPRATSFMRRGHVEGMAVMGQTGQEQRPPSDGGGLTPRHASSRRRSGGPRRHQPKPKQRPSRDR
jgi:hypothetical protein